MPVLKPIRVIVPINWDWLDGSTNLDEPDIITSAFFMNALETRFE